MQPLQTSSQNANGQAPLEPPPNSGPAPGTQHEQQPADPNFLPAQQAPHTIGVIPLGTVENSGINIVAPVPGSQQVTVSESPTAPQSEVLGQLVWAGFTKSLIAVPKKCVFTSANGTLTISRNGAPIYTSTLSQTQTSTNTTGQLLILNERGEFVRLMFISPTFRMIICAPLIVLMIGALLSKNQWASPLSLGALAAAFTMLARAESKSPARKQILASIEAAGGVLDASIEDPQVKATSRSASKILAIVVAPLMAVPSSAILYAITIAILQKMNISSSASSIIPMISIFIAIFLVMLKVWYKVIIISYNWVVGRF